MQVLIILLALGLLMAAAYRGWSVILFAPLAALLAVLSIDPRMVQPVFSAVFMERMVGFIKLYFPVFLLGAVFGKLMEVTGFARAIIQSLLRFAGPKHAILSVVLGCALLTYGGVSLFVVAFAVYPFGAELFRAAQIPKRLLPAAIALGAFTFTMDALPGTPQIQNIIPTTFFGTTTWAAPVLGIIGSVVLFGGGMLWLEWRRRSAQRNGEGYGAEHRNEPVLAENTGLPHAAIAILPLALVAGLNFLFTRIVPSGYGDIFNFTLHGLSGVQPLNTSSLTAIWAVEGALLVAILVVLAWQAAHRNGAMLPHMNAAVSGAMLAALNTGSEYGFGAVIAALPGFTHVSGTVSGWFQSPLTNAAVTTTVLAGITGSASGGMSIALGAMGATYLREGLAAGIPPEVLHRVTAMASGGMDTLPHNGAVITLLAIADLTHKESYRDIFALTVLKTLTVFVAIAAFAIFGLR